MGKEKLHEICIFATVVGYQGKKPVVEERAHQHSHWAFKNELGRTKNKLIYRQKPAPKPGHVTNLLKR